MYFEYDAKKSLSNAKKHGIDFEAAKLLWQDPNYVDVPAKSDTEERYMIIGKINDKLWSAFITYRGYRIRIISVRRSRKFEEDLYESI